MMIYDRLFCNGHPVKICRLFKPLRTPGRFVRTNFPQGRTFSSRHHVAPTGIEHQYRRMLVPVFPLESTLVESRFSPTIDFSANTRGDLGSGGFVPWDVEVARINFGANCGPTSFAAVLGLEVCSGLRHFPGFVERRWCNFTQMKQALRSCGVSFTTVRSKLPQSGLALVQWVGPWVYGDFGGRRSSKYTHWIGVDQKQIFDHTEAKWMPIAIWEEQVAAAFLQEISGATGWTVKFGIELMKSNNKFPSGANCFVSSSRATADNLSEYLAML